MAPVGARIGLAEPVEHPADAVGRDARSRIGDAEDQVALVARDLHQDVALFGELRRVDGKVEEDLANAAGIADDHAGQGGLDAHDQFDVGRRYRRGYLQRDILDEFGQIERCRVELDVPGFDPGKSKCRRWCLAAHRRISG